MLGRVAGLVRAGATVVSPQVAGRAGAAERVGPVVVTAMDDSRTVEYAKMVEPVSLFMTRAD